HAAPNLVVDPATGDGLYLQVADVDESPQGLLGQLPFARPQGGAWAARQPLPGAGHVSNPVLAQSHDRPGTPAVAVYQAFNDSGGAVGKTRGRFLSGQDPGDR